jgi:hypothetical protein
MAVGLYSAGGALLRPVPFANVSQLSIIGEVASRKLVVATLTGVNVQQGDVRNWTVAVIDTATARIVRTEHGLRPLASNYGGAFARDPRRPILGSAPIFVDAERKLVRWNPLTGEKKTVLSMAPDDGYRDDD